MNLTRRIYTTRREKTVDFLIGFFGWLILNAILSAVFYALSFIPATVGSYGDNTNYDQLQTILGFIGLICNVLAFFSNIGLLIYFGLTRYWIALGALTAFVTILVLVICAAVFLGAACFVMLGGLGGSTPTP
jgi:hypothetical protein